MKNKYASLLVLLFVIVQSCSESKSDKTNLKQMVSHGLLKIHLDSVSVADSEYSIEYFVENGNEYLAKFNRPDQSIKLFSLNNGLLYKSINMDTEGPNALLSTQGVPNEFKIITSDSIIVFDQVKSSLNLINEKAEILKKWPVISYNNNMKYPIFELGTFSKIMIRKEKFILSGNISWFDDGAPPIAVIPFDSTEVQSQVPEEFQLYDQYSLDQIGDRMFFASSNTLGKDEDIIISYALDHRVLILDETFNAKYITLENPRIGKLTTYGKQMTQEERMSDKYYKFMSASGIYKSIIYDEYRNVYYRIARLPVSIKDVEMAMEGKLVKGYTFSVLVYDLSFNPIGELEFNGLDYDPNAIFISKAGLNLMKNGIDEDLLTFETFTLDN